MSDSRQSALVPPAPLLYSGKVRDTYDVGDGLLLMVASDRISAFDVILPTAVPEKGAVLTQLSSFWFDRTKQIVPNHLSGVSVGEFGWDDDFVDWLTPRSMIVRRAERIPVECVVRGYLAGSGWAEYEQTGSVAGHELPTGLEKSSRLPAPIFTPAQKNDDGHDENITRDVLRQEMGRERADRLEAISLALYGSAAEHAESRGVLLADTKFEFGLIDGELTLIDEILTPDSSRFWDASSWRPGVEAQSWDKQYVRNWLIESGWDREPPGPQLPAEIVSGTTGRYLEAFERITGCSLDTWLRHGRTEATA